jgi:hypothetical protein
MSASQMQQRNPVLLLPNAWGLLCHVAYELSHIRAAQGPKPAFLSPKKIVIRMQSVHECLLDPSSQSVRRIVEQSCTGACMMLSLVANSADSRQRVADQAPMHACCASNECYIRLLHQLQTFRSKWYVLSSQSSGRCIVHSNMPARQIHADP